MPQMRAVHCKHCGQTLYSDNIERCDACGKPLESALNVTDLPVRSQFAEPQQQEKQVSAASALQPIVAAYKLYRLVAMFLTLLIAGPAIILLGIVLVINPPASGGGPWSFGAALPGFCAILAGVGFMLLTAWRFQRRT